MIRKRTYFQRHYRIVIMAIAAFLLLVATAAVLWYSFEGDASKDRSEFNVANKNVPYCGTKDPEQTLNLYVPSTPESDVPLVVYIHGGGWRSGTKDNRLIQYYRSVFLERGIAVAEIGYRLRPAHPYPDQNNDVACALRYLSDNRTTYGLAANRTVLFGDSAGGQLVASAALAARTNTVKYQYPEVQGVIDFYGVSDFNPLVNAPRPDMNARFYLGKVYAEAANVASPVAMVGPDMPPFLIVHGERDKIVPVSQSKLLDQKLREYQDTTTLLILPEAHHGFIGPELSTSSKQKLHDAVDMFLKQTIQS